MGTVLLLVAVSLLPPGSVWGQVQPPQACRAQVQAPEQEAERLFAAGRYPEAAARMQEVYARCRFWGYLWNAGRALEQAGDPRAACALFRTLLAGHPETPAEQRNLAQQSVAGCERGGLALTCEPADATLHLSGPGGKVAGRCPMTQEGLAPGSYTLQVEAPGHAGQRLELEVTPGQVQQRLVRLVSRGPAAAPVPAGAMAASGAEGSAAMTRVEEPLLTGPAGSVRVSGLHAGGWIAAGVGLVAVVGGAALLVHGNGLLEEGDARYQDYVQTSGQDRTALQEARSRDDEAVQAGQLAAACFVGAGLAALVGTGFFLLDREPVPPAGSTADRVSRLSSTSAPACTLAPQLGGNPAGDAMGGLMRCRF